MGLRLARLDSATPSRPYEERSQRKMATLNQRIATTHKHPPSGASSGMRLNLLTLSLAKLDPLGTTGVPRDRTNSLSRLRVSSRSWASPRVHAPRLASVV